MVSEKALITKLRKDLNYQYKIEEVKAFLDVFKDSVVKFIANGEEINLINFGRFYPKYKKSRILNKSGIPWMQGKTFLVPSKYSLSFKPAISTKKYVNDTIHSNIEKAQKKNANNF